MQVARLPYPTWKSPAELREVARAQRAQAETLRRDLRAYEALQLEAEQALEALRSEPFAPRFEEAAREQALRLQTFRAGREDCAAKLQWLEGHALQCEALASEREADSKAVESSREGLPLAVLLAGAVAAFWFGVWSILAGSAYLLVVGACAIAGGFGLLSLGLAPAKPRELLEDGRPR